MKKKLTTADLEKWPQSQPLTPKPKQMHTMSTYGKGTVGNPYTWSEYVALGNAFIQGFVCDPENPDVATLLTMPYMGVSESGPTYDSTSQYDATNDSPTPPPLPPSDIYNGFGEIWSFLTPIEQELVQSTGVRLVVNEEFSGIADYNPVTNTITVDNIGRHRAIKSELIHTLQQSLGLLNAGYDKSVEYEQNITYYFHEAINGFKDFIPPGWIAAEKGGEFKEWINWCIKNNTIDRARFYERIYEFFKYFKYNNNGIWEDKKDDYPFQWEQIFEQLGIPFK